MKKKNILWLILIPMILIIIGLLTYIIYNLYNDPTNFNLNENKWIDANKNTLIDINVSSDIPVISYDGSGVIFDFLSSMEENTNLKFNKSISKIDDNIQTSYSIKIVQKKSDNELLLLTDNYALVTNNGVVYNYSSDIRDLTIGVLSSDLEYFTNYFSLNNINLIAYDSYTDLINSLGTTNGDNTIAGIILLKDIAMNKVVTNDDVSIAYQFKDVTRDIVFSLNGDETLNSIFKKYYQKWYNNNYEDSYHKYLLNNYYSFANLTDNEQRLIKSKKYTYGFIENGIYDYMKGTSYKGINNLILKDFSKFANVSLNYKKYNSYEALSNAINNSEIDIIFSTNTNELTIESYNTIPVISDEYVVISKYNNDIEVYSLNSLAGKKVLTVKGSNIEQMLLDNNIEVKSYNNLQELVKDFKKDNIAVIEKENYIFYHDRYFTNTKIDYIGSKSLNYGYIINNNDDNKNFANLFQFYVTFAPINSIIKGDYSKIASFTKNYYIALILLIIVLVCVVILSSYKYIKRMVKKYHDNKKINLTKAEKIKYIDQLTLLKNRAYLNSRVEKWDENKIYPQAIIIIDLNNIAYINDNYGREEGDKVITEAANILIQSQEANTEIIRSDGNEFLIYLIGYSEKDVSAYLNKLIKALKALDHGFGAAGGYSMILDDIKTIDDAVNEATLAMREVKEDTEA